MSIWRRALCAVDAGETGRDVADIRPFPGLPVLERRLQNPVEPRPVSGIEHVQVRPALLAPARQHVACHRRHAGIVEQRQRVLEIMPVDLRIRVLDQHGLVTVAQAIVPDCPVDRLGLAAIRLDIERPAAGRARDGDSGVARSVAGDVDLPCRNDRLQCRDAFRQGDFLVMGRNDHRDIGNAECRTSGSRSVIRFRSQT